MKTEEFASLLQENRAVLKDHHVKALYLFGSVVRGEDRPGSDVDILVEFQPEARVGLFGLAKLQRRLAEILGRPVDLTTPGALHKALKDRIIKEAVRAAGDYIVDRQLSFERKTLQDFAYSIVDGRLFKQAIRLANSKLKAVLILEGTVKDMAAIGVRREAIQGALITISLILGIPVLRSQSPSESARFFLSLSTH
jgi:predicted nucleotidyltransferase